MQKIDNEQFGAFLVQLRKENRFTQKELAQKLYISDKAISKWERGLSLPDISLLLPLANVLGVSTTELLCGQRLEADKQFSVNEVESLMTKTLSLTKEERQQRSKAREKRIKLFWISILLFSLELLLFFWKKYSAAMLLENLSTVALLMLIFGAYFTFFAKDTLPVYYDENNINCYSDGFFRMNIPGVHFTNKNWPGIIKAAHASIMGIFVVFPLIYFVISYFFPALWSIGSLFFTLAAVFSMFIPIYIAGKKS